MSIENVERIDGVAQYDLIVIGSGSGNTLIGPEWDDKKVALIDGGIFGGSGGYTNPNELFGLGVRASASDNTPPLRNSVDDREPYRDDYAEPEQSGGFSLSSLLRKRTR